METMLLNSAKSKSMRCEATSGSTRFKITCNLILADAHGESFYSAAVDTDNFHIIHFLKAVIPADCCGIFRCEGRCETSRKVNEL